MPRNTIEVNHPLIQHKLTLLRDEKTSNKDFRDLLKELTHLLTYEATRDLQVREVSVQTPLAKTTGSLLANDIVIVAVLRAALGMLDGMLPLIPSAKVGFLGMYRDEETANPIEYYNKLPKFNPKDPLFLIDPMLATGRSLKKSIDILKRYNAENIKIMTLLSCPEGINFIHSYYPEIPIYTAKVDESLNENSFIIPGIGDAGDRIFRTK